MEKHRVRSLALITGAVCNLSCSYCFLCKEQRAKELDEEIIQSLKDGSYAENCYKSLVAYQSDPKDIVELQLWGGEPTIHADLFTEHITDWTNLFPSLERISISSNGQFDPQTLLKMFEALIINAPNFRRVFMQISIDGPDYISVPSRGVTFKQATDNFAELLTLVNNSKIFRERSIKFLPAFKATLPIDTINEIHATVESATEYYTFWAKTLHEWGKYQSDIIEHVQVNDITVVLMPDYTQAQGLAYAHSCRIFDSIDWQKIYEKYPPTSSELEISEMMHPLRKHDEFWESAHKMGHGYFCGQYIYSTHILPNGTIIGCLAGLYNNDEEYVNRMKESNFSEYISSQRISPQYYWNPQEHSMEENCQYKDHKYSFRSMQPIQMASSLSLMYDLSIMGQISPIYAKDEKIALKHAYLLFNRLGCYFNNIRETGLPYTPVMGMYRLYCNGVLEYFDTLRRERGSFVHETSKEN